MPCKDTCLKRDLTMSSKFISIPRSTINIIEKTYIFSLETNKHALLISITKSTKIFILIFANALL